MQIYSSLQQRIHTQHQAIPAIISGVDHQYLSMHPSPGKWSIVNNIAHLTRYQKVFLNRLDRILTEEQPAFDRYVAENDPEFEPYLSMSLAHLLQALDADRDTIFNRVTGFNTSELALTGTHPKFGLLTIVSWSEFFVLHEANHIFTIFQLANNKWQ